MTTREVCSKSVSHPENKEKAAQGVERTMAARRKAGLPAPEAPEPRDPGFVDGKGNRVSREVGLSTLTV